MLHDFTCKQLLPLWVGGGDVHGLVLFCVPPPHVTVQIPHEFHVLPSTKTSFEFSNYKYIHV